MSVFGQVWVFSAIAFVLGAFLAWLFLVRPAQRRIGELRRRLAEAQRAPKAATSTGSATSGAQNTLIAPAPGGDEDTPIASRTRRFEPAAETRSETAAGEATEHLAPGPRWPEQTVCGEDVLDGAIVRVDELDEGSLGSTRSTRKNWPDPGTRPPFRRAHRVPGGHAGRLNVDSRRRGDTAAMRTPGGRRACSIPHRPRTRPPGPLPARRPRARPRARRRPPRSAVGPTKAPNGLCPNAPRCCPNVSPDVRPLKASTGRSRSNRRCGRSNAGSRSRGRSVVAPCSNPPSPRLPRPTRHHPHGTPPPPGTGCRPGRSVPVRPCRSPVVNGRRRSSRSRPVSPRCVTAWRGRRNSPAWWRRCGSVPDDAERVGFRPLS